LPFPSHSGISEESVPKNERKNNWGLGKRKRLRPGERDVTYSPGLNSGKLIRQPRRRRKERKEQVGYLPSSGADRSLHWTLLSLF